MNKYLIGAIIAICLFIGGVVVGKYRFSTQDIYVDDRVVYTTIWKDKPAPDMPFTQENFNNLLFCATSDINFKERTDHSSLFVTAYDSCKENTVRYEIGSKGDWRVYGVITVLAAIAGGITAYKLTR